MINQSNCGKMIKYCLNDYYNITMTLDKSYDGNIFVCVHNKFTGDNISYESNIEQIVDLAHFLLGFVGEKQ